MAKHKCSKIRIKEEEGCDCPACQGETGQETEVEISVPIHLDEVAEEFMLRTRRLLVVGEINTISSTYICSQLQLLSLQKDPVYMYINSPGGCLASGYAIIDQMTMCQCPIYTIVRGQAHSMGAIIAAFGQRGHRYATSNSSMMLHSVIVQSPQESIESHTEMMAHIHEDYGRKVKALAQRLNMATKKLLDTMEKTIWMSPKQAIKIGLIDGIWTPKMERDINRSFVS